MIICFISTDRPTLSTTWNSFDVKDKSKVVDDDDNYIMVKDFGRPVDE